MRAAPVVLVMFAAVACGGSQPPPAAPEATENSTLDEPKPALATPPASPPADALKAGTAEPPAPPLAQVLATDAAVIQKTYDAANGAPAATLKPKGAAGTDALAKGVRDASKKLVAGMQPDGPLATGSLKEKQHLQTDVTLAPGKCYAIVGFSPKVKDLDLYLFMPAAGSAMLSGQDLTDDNHPIIGGAPAPMCPTGPAALTYKLDIVADTGAGDVAVQLYSKDK